MLIRKTVTMYTCFAFFTMHSINKEKTDLCRKGILLELHTKNKAIGFNGFRIRYHKEAQGTQKKDTAGGII